jgi:hypothetical protein
MTRLTRLPQVITGGQDIRDSTQYACYVYVM